MINPEVGAPAPTQSAAVLDDFEFEKVLCAAGTEARIVQLGLLNEESPITDREGYEQLLAAGGLSRTRYFPSTYREDIGRLGAAVTTTKGPNGQLLIQRTQLGTEAAALGARLLPIIYTHDISLHDLLGINRYFRKQPTNTTRRHNTQMNRVGIYARFLATEEPITILDLQDPNKPAVVSETVATKTIKNLVRLDLVTRERLGPGQSPYGYQLTPDARKLFEELMVAFVPTITGADEARTVSLDRLSLYLGGSENPQMIAEMLEKSKTAYKGRVVSAAILALEKAIVEHVRPIFAGSTASTIDIQDVLRQKEIGVDYTRLMRLTIVEGEAAPVVPCGVKKNSQMWYIKPPTNSDIRDLQS